MMKKRVSLTVHIKRGKGKFPTKGTPGSVGLDIYPSQTYTIPPREMVTVDTNLIVKPQEGYGVFVFPRSSLFKNKGLILVNSVGVIDPDYCGPDCTIKLQLYNMRDTEVVLDENERVAQLVLLPVTSNVVIRKSPTPPCNKDRGGLGSTGGYNNNVNTQRTIYYNK